MRRSSIGINGPGTFAETISIMHHALTAPLPEDLQCLLTQLQADKYRHLESLCSTVYSGILAVQINDMHDAARHYSGLCMKLHDQVMQYLRMHRLVIVPYISDLIEKEDTGHDCGACGGGCSIRHSAHIADIRDAHSRMAEVLSWLREAANEFSVATEVPEGWRSLRSNMLLLNAALTELLFIEESALIPMMLDLQSRIRAHG